MLPARGPVVDVPEPDMAVVELLRMLRRAMGMDVAWLSQIRGDVQILRVLDGDYASFGLMPGSTIRAEGGYFARILSGELPSMIVDSRRDVRTAGLAATAELGLGAYAATPVITRDGGVYGMLGCLSHESRPWLRSRDGRFMRLLAEVLADSVSDLQRVWEGRNTVWERVSRVIDSGGPEIVFQPIFDLRRDEIVGVEALSRFPGSGRDPEGWFADATAIGLGVELELVAARSAMAALPRIPAGLDLAVNISPRTVIAGLPRLLSEVDADRVLVEITEHDRLEDTPGALAGIAALRGLGARIAADDVGAGYSGLAQLIELRPDVIKVDRRLTHGIDTDPARRAVAAGLVRVTEEIGGVVLAEGIETVAERRTVAATNIDHGQGDGLAPPAPLAHLPCAGRLARAGPRRK
ncbi:sensor domain-containing phosphodiesterase [Parafrankia discariae]|uniref:sensor domain-containing phosphodiesterase n=1 Tax=Parafrankia discariae TaxID=365528 RepID=UPI00037E0C3C|nr:EAL domain-containing protein [Parafrankia discariae]